MDKRPVGQIDHSVNSLSELHFEGQTMDSIMGHIARLAVQSLDGWDAVAASLATGDKVATYGATDGRINPVDQAQYDVSRGPCVDALKLGETRYFDGTHSSRAGACSQRKPRTVTCIRPCPFP